MSTGAFTTTASAYLQATGMSDEAVARVAADLTAMAQQHIPAAQAPLSINGWHLLDALNCIAPERTTLQLATKICIHGAPVSTETPQPIADDPFCWMTDFPDEGAIKLDGRPQLLDASATQGQIDVVAIATNLINAARWVGATASARRQPDARALARCVLKLTRPIIDAHADRASSRDGR